MKERGERREKRTYKKDISGFFPTHIRLLGLSNLHDKPVQPLGNLLP